MSKKAKLITKLFDNPKAVRFDDACKIAELLGFKRKGEQGSHCVFGKIGEPTIINFQNRNGYILPYQARQLIEMVQKYEEREVQIPH